MKKSKRRASAKAPRNRLHPAAPADGGESILLAVTGLSPAILTETVWALAAEKIVPDRVIAITTAGGRSRLVAELCEPSADFGGLCVWESLRASIQALGLSTENRLRLEPRVMHCWRKGRPLPHELDDLRTLDDSQAAADFILGQVRSLAETPDTRIIASIAGGRKTMGALLHAAITLIGRETDRITHVPVPEPYDSPQLSPRFYFPAQPCGSLATAQGAVHHARNCRIELQDVPFVPLRNLFEKELVKKPRSFHELVQRCRLQVHELARKDCRLVLRRSEPEIIINDMPVRLSPGQYALLKCLADRALAKLPAINSFACAADPVRACAEELYALHDANDFSDWRFKVQPSDGFEGINERWVTRTLSDIRHALKRHGPAAAALLPLLPRAGRFSLDLEPACISFED